MKILVYKSLFVPNETFIDRNIETIDIFLQYLSHINPHYDIIFKIVGWINPDINSMKIITYLKSLEKSVNNIAIRKNPIVVEYEIWGVNRGKLFLIRELRRIYPMYRKCSLIIYADHDIAPVDDIIPARIILGNKIELDESKEVAMVGFRQTPDNRNNPRIFENYKTFMDIKFYYSIENSDVASGCFMTLPKYLKLFSELDSDHIYGDEDLKIAEKLSNENMICVLSDRSVHHPHDVDKEYAEWKKNIAISILTDNEPEVSNYWDDN